MIDEIDGILIRELIKNSRTPYRDLAKLVSLTDVAIIKRIKRLEREGVIKKYTTIVNAAALGYSKISFTGINVKPERLFDIVKVLKDKEYVKYLALTSGDHDILAVIWSKSANELEMIHDEIRRLDGVISVYPMILTEVVKDEAYI